MHYHDAIAFRQALTDRLRRQYPDQNVGLAADVATVARAGAWLDHLVERIHQHSSN